MNILNFTVMIIVILKNLINAVYAWIIMLICSRNDIYFTIFTRIFFKYFTHVITLKNFVCIC